METFSGLQGSALQYDVSTATIGDGCHRPALPETSQGRSAGPRRGSSLIEAHKSLIADTQQVVRGTPVPNGSKTRATVGSAAEAQPGRRARSPRRRS